MALSLILACVWVFASTIVAMLPMHLQFPPGVVLFASAPALILWLSLDYGWFVGILAAGGFVSMYRNPIRYYWRKWTGKEVSE